MTAPRCFSCGYDLTGVRGRCPECGRWAVDERDALNHEAVGDRRVRWMGLLILLGIVSFLVVCVARCG